MLQRVDAVEKARGRSSARNNRITAFPACFHASLGDKRTLAWTRRNDANARSRYRRRHAPQSKEAERGSLPSALCVALPANAHLHRLTMSLRILVVTLLMVGLVLLDRHRVCLCDGIMPHAGHLPADPPSWVAAGNLE